MSFARGKRAFGFCDRTGRRYPIADLVDEYQNGTKTGFRVGRDVADKDHPQNHLGRLRIFDPQTLMNPRPDTALDASRALYGFKPVGHPSVFMQGGVGQVTTGGAAITPQITGVTVEVENGSASGQVGEVTPDGNFDVAVITSPAINSQIGQLPFVTNRFATAAVGTISISTSNVLSPSGVSGSGSVGSPSSSGTSSSATSGSSGSGGVGSVTVSTA